MNESKSIVPMLSLYEYITVCEGRIECFYQKKAITIGGFKNVKSIFVLLTQHRSFMGRFIQITTFSRYTHAALSVEIEDGTFYSVVIKNGFYKEHPFGSHKLKKLARQCSMYRLNISDDIYFDIKTKLNEYQKGVRELHYSFLSVILCIFRIPHHITNGYFCSQFVAEILSSAGAIIAQKDLSVFLPDDFCRVPQLELCYQGTVGELAGAIRQAQSSL